MKRWIALLLTVVALCGLVGCAQTGNDPVETTAPETDNGGTESSLGVLIGQAERRKDITAENIKVGIIYVDDLSDKGWTTSHYDSINKMAANLGISEDQIIHKFNIPEDAKAATALSELVEAGCDIIFGTAYGHGDYMLEAAQKYLNIEFCHATGYQAPAAKLPNFHNYFADIKESRYYAGVVAGLATKSNMIGYIGFFPYAEVISAYDAMYLGAKSVNPDVKMKVMYTNSWYDPLMEDQATTALINGGCDVIFISNASVAPATGAAKLGAYHIGFGADLTKVVPEASLMSVMIDWSVYDSYAVSCILKGEDIALDWCEGFQSGAVYATPVNAAIAPANVEEATAKAVEWMANNTIFTGPLYDNNGQLLLADGEKFTEKTSCFTWDHVLQGIEIIGE
ncbi:MAG: BMP family ABC transporter substrate-binding protein [Bacillota bacterium]